MKGLYKPIVAFKSRAPTIWISQPHSLQPYSNPCMACSAEPWSSPERLTSSCSCRHLQRMPHLWPLAVPSLLQRSICNENWLQIPACRLQPHSCGTSWQAREEGADIRMLPAGPRSNFDLADTGSDRTRQKPPYRGPSSCLCLTAAQ